MTSLGDCKTSSGAAAGQGATAMKPSMSTNSTSGLPKSKLRGSGRKIQIQTQSLCLFPIDRYPRNELETHQDEPLHNGVLPSYSFVTLSNGRYMLHKPISFPILQKSAVRYFNQLGHFKRLFLVGENQHFHHFPPLIIYVGPPCGNLDPEEEHPSARASECW